MCPPQPDQADGSPTLPPRAGGHAVDTTGGDRYARGQLIGRYVVLGELGAGTMGVVYRAFDPELDRSVALKVLKGREGPDGSARVRLLREAQALAKLSHQNVVAVYDVGSHNGDVFLAMELIGGTDLASWLAAETPDWRTAVSVIAAAGRGLAAAHELGLVHRDFKPANILVSRSRRALVSDFGLARPAADLELDSSADPNESSLSSGALAIALTQDGDLVGTPAYMAPEQYVGAPADTRTDQYAFGVTLYEGVYMRRPFSSALRRDVAHAKAEGLSELPDSPSIPTWLRGVLVRAMSGDPKERYPNMNELLADLERGPALRRRIGLGVAAVAVTAAVAVGSMWAGARRDDRCEQAGMRADALWGEEARMQVESAFLDTRRSYAPATFAAAAGELDHSVNAWRAMKVEACEATWVRGEQSQELLDLRMRCLEARGDEIEAVVATLRNADEAVVRHGLEIVSSVRGLQPCADREALRAAQAPPAEIAHEVQTLSATIATVRSAAAAAHYDEALATLEPVMSRAEALEYAPLQIEARLALGQLLDQRDELDSAEQTLLEAATLARAAGHARDEADAWISLVAIVGAKQRDFSRGRLMAEIAEATLDSVGEARRQRAWLRSNLGTLAFVEGKTGEARELFEEALAVRIELVGEDAPVVASTLNNLAGALERERKHEEALAHLRRAVAIRTRTNGQSHPEVGLTRANVGLTLISLDRLDEADEELVAAHSNLEAALGARHPRVAQTLNALGDLRMRQGQPAKALEHYREVVATLRAAHGGDHPMLALPLSRVGEAEVALARPDAARPPLREALALFEKHGGDPVRAARTKFALARALIGAEPDQARDLATAARESLAAAGPRGRDDVDEINDFLAALEPGRAP